MAYVLCMGSVIIGRSELEERDPERRTARGRFRPGFGYDLVEPVFAIYGDALAAGDEDARRESLDRFTRARDALRLELVREPDHSLRSRDARVVRGSHDTSALELEVVILDERFWSNS